MKTTRIAVDAMGGDHAPGAIVDGCVQALGADKEIHLILVGDARRIKNELKRYTYDKDRLEIVGSTQIITNHEPPVTAVRKKKDASLVKAFNLVKEGKAEAIISAGSTGAILAGGTLILGRIKGIARPALGTLIPGKKGVTLLIDCGANVDSKPQFLLQFAQMGSVYYESLMGVENPKVGLANIGEEEGKGNALVKDAYGLLKKDPKINFIGNIEAREIPSNECQVVVCDGFVGNIILKYTEGLASALLGMVKSAILSTPVSKVGGILIKGSFKKMMKTFDYTEYGGAPLLGLEGLVVKSHGSSNAKAIKNAVLQCKKFSDKKVNEKIKENIVS